MPITYIQGDATKPVTRGNIIIAHVVNNVGAYGAGFSGALERAYPGCRDFFKSTHPIPGVTVFQPVSGNYHDDNAVCIAHMFAQDGLIGPDNWRPIRYDWLETCLDRLGHETEYTDSYVHMPRIGCGLAGGKWNEVEDLINKSSLAKSYVYVYDLPEVIR